MKKKTVTSETEEITIDNKKKKRKKEKKAYREMSPRTKSLCVLIANGVQVTSVA